MNNFIHTLTAYKLEFSYMKRNNPLREELEEKIKNEERPHIVLTEFISEFIEKTTNSEYDALSNGGKIILLDKIEHIENPKPNVKRVFIKPSVGKRDIPIYIVNLKNRNQKYNFKKDCAATYSNNLFLYEINDEYYCICHRHGGSGCKTIFASAMNQILKTKGIKMEMNWMPPNVEGSNSVFDIDKITLIYEVNKSSDIADEPTRKKKKITVKELTLNLNQIFPSIKGIMKRYQLKEISQESAMNEIKNTVNDQGYNNACVLVKIGNAHKKVAWDDLEGLIDGFDITEKVANTGDNFIKTLTQCADDFIFELLGVV